MLRHSMQNKRNKVKYMLSIYYKSCVCLIVAALLCAALEALRVENLSHWDLRRRRTSTATVEVAEIFEALGLLLFDFIFFDEDHVAKPILADVVLELLLLIVGQTVPIRMMAVEHAASLELVGSTGDVEGVHPSVTGKRQPDVHYKEILPGLSSGPSEAGRYFVAFVKPSHVLIVHVHPLLLHNPAGGLAPIVDLLNGSLEFNLSFFLIRQPFEETIDVAEGGGELHEETCPIAARRDLDFQLVWKKCSQELDDGEDASFLKHDVPRVVDFGLEIGQIEELGLALLVCEWAHFRSVILVIDQAQLRRRQPVSQFIDSVAVRDG